MSAAPTLSDLRALIDGGDADDRAFVDAEIRRRHARAPDDRTRLELGTLCDAVREAADREHAKARQEIATGSLQGARLRTLIEKVPRFARDHFVEELLGIAYPPLDEPQSQPELVHYAPSGIEEILHAFATVKLGPGDRFVDLGSGLGKVSLLARLLTGAEARGIELDATLVAGARSAALVLSLEDVRFEVGDARDASLEEDDVIFMYVPFVGSVLATVIARIEATNRGRRRFVCAAPIDRDRHLWLTPVGSGCGWLQVYASGWVPPHG